MPLIPRLLSLLLLASSSSAQTRPSAVMLRYPDVSQHSIVFRHADDLWIVGKEGGVAQRITSALPPESFPKFSPDGTQLAFMAGYDGGSDLYVMPVEGGVPLRVTHHGDTEVLCDWHPDGKRLLFFSPQLSGQTGAPKLFLVSATGGQPEALPVPYGTFASIDSTGEQLAYTPTSREFRTWNRYRGGMAQDLWVFNLKTQAVQRLTDDPGTDSMPMWRGSEILFLSDRGGAARMNLFAHDVTSGSLRQLTAYEDADVRFPSVGPEDVVFENGGKLFRFSFASDSVAPVEIIIPGDRPALRHATHDVGHLAREFDLGPGAKRIALEARGEVFTVPVDQGFTRNLTRTSGVAERCPRWSPDGEWIAYFSDRSGEYELTLRRSDGRPFEGADERGERVLTSLGPGWKEQLQWAPDGRRLSFTTHGGDLYVVERETGELHRVTSNPSGEPLTCDWSPDSAWLTWSHRHSESRLGAIYAYELHGRRVHELTSGMFDDRDPCFDRAGRWLYYHSARTFEPSFADLDTTWIYANTRNLMAVPLRAETRPRWEGRNDEEPGEREPAAASAAPAADGLRFDLDGFERRARILPLPAGRVSDLHGLPGGLIYLRLPRTGSAGETNSLMLFDMESDDPAERTVLAGVDTFRLNAGHSRLLVSQAGRWGVVDVAPDREFGRPIDLAGLRVVVEPRAEWRQLVDETMRLFRDFFYDPNMHGVDWSKVHERARKALDDATSREDVQVVIGNMIAELNVGHATQELPPSLRTDEQARVAVGLLGCNFKVDAGAFKIETILAGGAYDADARSPLWLASGEVREGDYLLAVNGVPVDVGRDVYAHFLGTAGVPTRLTLNGTPTTDGAEREVLVRPLASEVELRYRDWIRRKREYVAQESGGRIGYVHVPDTGTRGQGEFVRQFLGQMHEPALIIDERWNSGGRVPTRFIELLERPLTNFWAVRHGEDRDWPPTGHRGPKAMLINHASSSGGDTFPYYFRQAGLGALIGTRTWGGAADSGENPALIDGAVVSVPRLGFYELDGTWGIEGHGIEPDIQVFDDPSAMLRGEDPQLDAAIEHLEQQLETWPFPRKTRPAPPDRSGAGVPLQDR